MVVPNYVLIPFEHWSPFRVTNLPAIGRLYKYVYRRYSKRWEKRIFKKPTRWIFDLFYHVFKLGGRGDFDLQLPLNIKNISFDARKAHFSILYLDDYMNYGYEPDVAGVLAWLLNGHRNGAFYDIGANWGFFSFYAATLKNFSGEIHAFEPTPDTFKDIESLIDQTQLEKRIKAYQIAISDLSGLVGMSAIDPLSSGVNRILDGATDYFVEAVKLDELEIARPNIIKIDVEEHEYQVLLGAKNILSSEKPFVIFENWLHPDPDHFLRPLRLMEDFGYVLYYPCWYHGEWRTGSLQAKVPAFKKINDIQMCLKRFQAEDRVLFKEQMNVLAVHQSRINDFPDNAEKIVC